MLRRPVWAVVPAKSFARGKSRLRPVLADAERARFAGTLLEHTLSVLTASGLDGVLVATDGDEVADLARAYGAQVLRDDSRARENARGAEGGESAEGKGGPRLAAVVDGALIEVEARGAKAAIVVMADLPRITVDDVAQLVEALDLHDVVLVRDHQGMHTNAMGVAPPTALRTCFGRADSFAAHCGAARSAQLDAVVIDNERVAFDVDAPADHARLSAPAQDPLDPPAPPAPQASGT
jgi:2-phospho-L-lactate guanylyltransferase